MTAFFPLNWVPAPHTDAVPGMDARLKSNTHPGDLRIAGALLPRS
jgi:hypothetical protein